MDPENSSELRDDRLMSTPVLLGLAVKVLIPSLSLAPTGIADTTRDKRSEPSVSLAVAIMLDKRIGLSL